MISFSTPLIFVSSVVKKPMMSVMTVLNVVFNVVHAPVKSPVTSCDNAVKIPVTKLITMPAKDMKPLRMSLMNGHH